MLTLVLSALLGQSPIVLPPRPHRGEVAYEYRFETRYDRRGRTYQTKVLVPARAATQSRSTTSETYTTGGGCQIINGVRVCPLQR